MVLSYSLAFSYIMMLYVNPYYDVNSCIGVSCVMVLVALWCYLLTHFMVLAHIIVLAHDMVFAVNPYYGATSFL